MPQTQLGNPRTRGGRNVSNHLFPGGFYRSGNRNKGAKSCGHLAVAGPALIWHSGDGEGGNGRASPASLPLLLVTQAFQILQPVMW